MLGIANAAVSGKEVLHVRSTQQASRVAFDAYYVRAVDAMPLSLCRLSNLAIVWLQASDVAEQPVSYACRFWTFSSNCLWQVLQFE